ncbi:Putative pyruvate, phosphate dikinase regulatory protein [Frankliniella fusca]|uniref:Pyruvate, phosphate dikinase regulatory protein n=1 Tax=Frankliniella fusca TaxID=407009 RepID=A0AAE1GWY1_9NEOP|nr:Putative pyruvate, phosphate dikinase regulatory protein [Frankliniella fusca]
MSFVLLADLPPTSDRARQHSLRVYLTVQDWLGNSLDPTQWGWYRGERSLHPVPSKLSPAPQELLHLIAGNFKAGCRAGSGCSCRKAELPCTPACGKCRGERCSNTVEGDEADWENL